MLNKTLVLSCLVSMAMTTSSLAFSGFTLDLNEELQRNTKLIEKYKNNIRTLEKRNELLTEKKTKNPELYEKKSLYEETKEAYIHRVKLNGAEAKNISFTIKNHILSMEMNIKTEQKTNESYYASSQYFFQSYMIPSNVDESKIKYEVDGDYFVVVMPKK